MSSNFTRINNEAVTGRFQVQDIKSSGTEGGASISGYNKRTLNSVIYNDIEGATLLSDNITLPAGKYFIKGTTSSQAVGRTKTCIRNIDDNTYILGLNDRTFTTSGCISACSGIVEISEPKTFEILTWCELSDPFGLGTYTNSGQDEVYNEILVEKLGY